MTDIRNNGSWQPAKAEALDKLKERLQTLTLNPSLAPFQQPYLRDDGRTGYTFAGDFMERSAMFWVWTDDVHEIAELSALIHRNAQTADYNRAVVELDQKIDEKRRELEAAQRRAHAYHSRRRAIHARIAEERRR